MKIKIESPSGFNWGEVDQVVITTGSTSTIVEMDVVYFVYYIYQVSGIMLDTWASILGVQNWSPDFRDTVMNSVIKLDQSSWNLSRLSMGPIKGGWSN